MHIKAIRHDTFSRKRLLQETLTAGNPYCRKRLLQEILTAGKDTPLAGHAYCRHLGHSAASGVGHRDVHPLVQQHLPATTLYRCSSTCLQHLPATTFRHHLIATKCEHHVTQQHVTSNA